MAQLLWIVFNVLPDAVSLWLLDTFMPDWTDRVRAARGKKRAK